MDKNILRGTGKATGTDTYAVTLSVKDSAYVGSADGTQRGVYLVSFANTNTGASTLDVNGLGAKSIVKNGSTALVSGDIVVDRVYIMMYDGTNFQMIFDEEIPANERIDHSTITLTAGVGLTGGGDITTNRTFDLDIPGLTDLTDAGVLASTDTLAVYNASATAHEEATIAQLQTYMQNNLTFTPALTQEEVEDYAGALVANATGTHTGITITYQDATNDMDFVVDHDAANNYVANEHIDHSTVSIDTSATSGLNGGGDLTATRNIVVAPDRATALGGAPDGADIFLIADVDNGNALRGVTVTDLLTLAPSTHFGNTDLTLDANRTHALNGFDVQFDGASSTALKLFDNGSFLLGGATATKDNTSVAIGTAASANFDSAIAIGKNAAVSANDGISIGKNSDAAGKGVAIGHVAQATASNCIAIGNNAQATGGDGIMLATATVARNNSTASSMEVNFNETTSTFRFGQSVDGWLNSSGDFGIGNTAPTAKLHVTGAGATGATTNLLLENSGNNNLLKVQDNASIVQGYDVAADFYYSLENDNAAGSPRLRILGAGTLNAGFIGVGSTSTLVDSYYQGSNLLHGLGGDFNLTYSGEMKFVKDNTSMTAPTVEGTINSSGQWAIGNDHSPTARLHVKAGGTETVIFAEDSSGVDLFDLDSAGALELPQTTSTMIIGGNGVAISTMLELKGTTGGFMMNRMTEAQRDALTVGAGQDGLQVFNTDTEHLDVYRTQFGEWQKVGVTQEIKKSLSNAQILALNTTPIEVIPAPGAGYAIEITSASYRFNYGTAAFATSTNLQLRNPSATNAQYFSTTFLSNTATKIIIANRNPSSTNSAIVENEKIEAFVPAADPTSGTGSTVDIYVTYRIIKL